MQTCIPRWMAPNLITLLGLLFPLISLCIFACYSPHFRTEPPAWTFFFNAFALFAYQTLDNMDGKQARRTQSSNALGMVFDHGCDAINAGIGAINLLVVLGLMSSGMWEPFLVLSAVATPFLPFYVATWEEYYVGALILPVVNGPAEGVLLGVMFSLISGLCGSAWWGKEHASLLALDWLPVTRPGEAVGWFSLVSIVLTCLCQIGNVLLLQHRKGRSIVQPLLDLLPFAALAGGASLLIATEHELLIEAPLLTLGTIAAIFVEQVVSLMLAHMTHSLYVPYHRTLLPAFLLFVALVSLESWEALKGRALSAERLWTLWHAHFLVVFAYTALYLVLIVAELSRVLEVRPFRIKDRGGAPEGKATAVNGRMKMQ